MATGQLSFSHAIIMHCLSTYSLPPGMGLGSPHSGLCHGTHSNALITSCLKVFLLIGGISSHKKSSLWGEFWALGQACWDTYLGAQQQAESLLPPNIVPSLQDKKFLRRHSRGTPRHPGLKEAGVCVSKGVDCLGSPRGFFSSISWACTTRMETGPQNYSYPLTPLLWKLASGLALLG